MGIYTEGRGIDITAFTYFKDEDGFIYYASGEDCLLEEKVRSILVYAPVTGGGAVRYQPHSDTSYAKCVSHGYSSEEARLREVLTPDQHRKITALFSHDEVSGDEFLAVPTRKIVEVYNPGTALSKLLEGDERVYSTRSVEKVRIVVNILANAGIASSRLGLYGGMQCSLVHADGREINDIDILVRGVGAYGAVVDLAKGNVVRPETFPDFVASNTIKRAVAVRRGQLSQFRLPDYPDTVVDIRLVRAAEDSKKAVASLKEIAPMEELSLEGVIVVDASESLSVPACYVVQDASGRIWSVVTHHYHHLGAATRGDMVSICGVTVDASGVVALTSPDRHYIYKSNQMLHH